MMLLKFFKVGGAVIFINTDHVVSVVPGNEKTADVKLITGDVIQIDDSDNRAVDDLNRGMGAQRAAN